MKRFIVTIALCVLTAPVGCAQTTPTPEDAIPKESIAISTFAECIAAGNPVTRSIPAQCHAQGAIFYDPAYNYKKPLLPKGSLCKDTCGDGVCAEIVCQATGCPCAESKASCPEDCSDSP